MLVHTNSYWFWNPRIEGFSPTETTIPLTTACISRSKTVTFVLAEQQIAGPVITIGPPLSALCPVSNKSSLSGEYWRLIQGLFREAGSL